VHTRRSFGANIICLVASLFALMMRAAEWSPAADDYIVQVWDTDSGLPHTTVTSIAQTPDGYLWVGTLHGGLARFDGTRFVNFDPGNTPELKSIEIHKLLVDPQGTLWIANVEGGLISERGGRFHFEYWNNDTPRAWVEEILSGGPERMDFASRPGMIFQRTESAGSTRWQTLTPPNAHPVAMPCELANGTIWYRLSNGQLAQLRGTNAVALGPLPGLKPTVVNALVKDVLGRLWIGTENGLAVWNGTNFTSQTPTNGDDVAVRSMLPCADGGFWVMTPHHLRKLLHGEWTCSFDLSQTNAEADNLAGFAMQFTDSRSGVWLWHDQKKLIYISREGKISHLGDAGGKLVGSVQCWLEDHEGNLWLGLNEGGLARLRPRIFHAVWPDAGVDSKVARAVCQDERGVLWFGSGSRQVWRWADGAFTNFTPTNTSYFEDTKVCPAGDGVLWVGSVQNGLLRLHNSEFTRPFDSRTIGTVARSLLRDRQGELWIGSEFGLFRYDETSGLKTFTRTDGFTPAYVLSLAEDTNGDLWCGTALGELRRMHAGQFTSFRPPDSLTDAATLRAASTADPMVEHNRGALSGGERFWALHFDADGALWIGSLGGGLLRFKDGKFTRFTTHEDLPSEHVNQILEDNHDQLWLGTRAGVVRVSRRELDAFADGAKELPNFVTYGKSDGLPALECSGGSQPNCWRSRDGRLWFTTVKGAVWVDPSQLRLNRLPPPVRVEEVLLDGKSLIEPGASTAQPVSEPPKIIRISAGQHYFEFKFCALSFTSPDKVKFRWRLTGVEKDWVDGGDRHAASYSFIPPGSYHFEVSACNNDGIWSSAPAAVELTVLPYFWQTWWFKLAGALFAATLLLTLYTVRITRLRALEKLRLRIARDLHDEVGANLGSISLLAQMMEQTPSSADAAQVRGIAVQTIDTLRDIIWFIDPTHDKLSDLVARLQETARVMLPAVRCKFEQSGDFSSANLSLAFRRNVPPLFKETLHNLLKHAHATAVEISVRRRENEFAFSVKDNGVGFNATQKNSGNGLQNLKRRAAEIGGRIEIESRAGGGTTVTLTAPITQTRDWWQA